MCIHFFPHHFIFISNESLEWHLNHYHVSWLIKSSGTAFLFHLCFFQIKKLPHILLVLILPLLHAIKLFVVVTVNRIFRYFWLIAFIPACFLLQLYKWILLIFEVIFFLSLFLAMNLKDESKIVDVNEFKLCVKKQQIYFFCWVNCL